MKRALLTCAISAILATTSFAQFTGGGSGSTGGAGDVGSISASTATNPSAEATLKELTLTSAALNAAGKKILIHASGRYTTAAAQTPTLRFRTYLCTVSGCGSGTVITLADFTTAATTAATTNSWKIEGTVGTVTSGATGTVESKFSQHVQLGAAADLTPETRLDQNNAVSASVDLTGVLYVRTTVLMSSANAGNSVTQRTGWVDGGAGAGSSGFASTDIDTCAELAAIMAGETGTCGSFVLSNSPSLVTPDLGTPSALVCTNCSGTAPSLTAGTASVANSGDSATSFFSSGTIEDARLPTSMADKVITGSLQLPNGAAPTTDAFGEIAGDSNAWAASRGAIQFFDGTANTYAVGVLASDTPANGECPKWNTGGTITWESCTGGAGSMATDTLWAAQGDLAYATANDTATVLPKGTALQVLRMNAGATAPEWATAGSGTVTVVGAGSLTSTALVTGGGTTTLQTPAATATMDSSGNISTPGTISTGVGSGVAGGVEMVQGTAPTAGTTSVKLYAPASVTSYILKLPAASATGLLLGTDAAGVNTMSFSTVGTGVLASLATANNSAGGYSPIDGTAVLTNKTVDCEATGNICTIPRRLWFPAAGVSAGTASSIWDLPTTNPAVAGALVGTNTVKGVLDFADGANTLSAQITYKLPSTWTGTVDATIKWLSATTTNNVVWQLATICVADAETDDPAFNTASTVTDTAKGTTNQTNDATITGVTVTGCAAGELMHVKIFRDPTHASDTHADTARLIGVELVIREAI